MSFGYLQPLVRDLIRMSLLQVERNRRRLKGVTIAIAGGMAGLIVVINLGDSVERAMGKHLTILGRSTIVDVEMVDDDSDHPRGFTIEDVSRLQAIPHVMHVAPHVSAPEFEASYYRQKMIVRVTGVNHSFWNTIMASLVEGAPTDVIHEKNRAAVCVLGTNVSQNLFKGLNPIGKRVRIGRMSCVVIGTLGGIQSLDTRRTAFLPLSTARHRFNGLYDIKAIRLRVDHWTNTESVAAQARETLTRRHHSRVAESIRVYHYPERIKKVQNTIDLIKILAVLAWSVILVIGAAGIAVLMVTAVRDRRREIGLKKAVGATRAGIMAQFLMEAVIVSCKGGMVGMILGAICCLVLQSALGLQVSPSVFLISISVGLVGAVALGIVAGIYPATIACNMDPAVSMRSD